MQGQKMIYDPESQKIILFGGSYYSSSYTFYDDTWSLDTAKYTWTNIQTTNSPSARFSAGMVYDGDHKKIILFGGFSASDRKSDTWIYDIATSTWTNVTPDKSPPRRSDMGIAYDAGAKKVVIFGGYNRDDTISDDTWVYDFEANTWTQMNPANHPSARYGGAMVFDSYSKKILLFGGHKGSVYDNEIWAYNYSNDDWEKIETQTKPPGRYWHDLAYDSVSQRMILFGGSQGGGNDLGDTWVFACRDSKWVNVTSTVNPPARSLLSLAYDVSVKKTVMFGGADFGSQGYGIYSEGVWILDDVGQWKKLSAESFPSEPDKPEPSIPGFQPLEVIIGLILALTIIVHTCVLKGELGQRAIMVMRLRIISFSRSRDH